MSSQVTKEATSTKMRLLGSFSLRSGFLELAKICGFCSIYVSGSFLCTSVVSLKSQCIAEKMLRLEKNLLSVSAFSYLDGEEEKERFYVFSSGCFNGGQMEGKMKESHLYKSFLDGRLCKGESAIIVAFLSQGFFLPKSLG